MKSYLPSKPEADRTRDEQVGRLHLFFYTPRETLDCGHPPKLSDYFHGDAFRDENGREICPDCVKAKGDDRVLSCGHKPSPHSEFTTGTAWVPAEGETKPEREICCTCADRDQREALLKEQSIFAYLSEVKAPSRPMEVWRDGVLTTVDIPYGPPTSYITTWTGGVLAVVTPYYWSREVWCWGRKSRRYYFNAVDCYGQQWYGTSPGPNMYCRMRKKKHQQSGKTLAPVKVLGDKYPAVLPDTSEEEVFLRLGTTSTPDRRTVEL